MIRREQAGVRADKMKRKIDMVEYKIEDDDIIMLSGRYAGKTVKEIFFNSATERDYIVEKIWMGGDKDVVRIINSLVCE